MPNVSMKTELTRAHKTSCEATGMVNTMLLRGVFSRSRAEQARQKLLDAASCLEALIFGDGRGR